MDEITSCLICWVSIFFMLRIKYKIHVFYKDIYIQWLSTVDIMPIMRDDKYPFTGVGHKSHRHPHPHPHSHTIFFNIGIDLDWGITHPIQDIIYSLMKKFSDSNPSHPSHN